MFAVTNQNLHVFWFIFYLTHKKYLIAGVISLIRFPNSHFTELFYLGNTKAVHTKCLDYVQPFIINIKHGL